MELTKEQARRPDLATEQLKKGFQWTTQHSKLVGLFVGVGLLVGTTISIWSFIDGRKETQLQERYHEAERIYLGKKEKFEQYQATNNRPVDPKTKVAPKPEGEKSTGDLKQDYGQVVDSLEALVKEAPGSRAAGLSALTLGQIYQNYHKKDEALEVLKKAQGTPGPLGAMVRTDLGTILANNGDCKSALGYWADVLKDRSVKFLQPQVNLKMGLCLESMGQKTEAADHYKQVIADAKDSSAGKSAEKLLKMVQTQTP